MKTSADKESSTLIKKFAAEVGFDLCGIAKAKSLDEHRLILKRWTYEGMNSDMAYLGQNIEKRIDPRLLVPGARSIIVTGLNYYSEKKQGGNGIPVISRYAYGVNYHDVIKEKLLKILAYIKSLHPESEGKCFVDSAPILEKAWGREAGLGWTGKHSILINRHIGSFFFLGVIIINIELEYDQPIKRDSCGKCTSCIEACPTRAINNNRTIDTRICLAYQTLESKTPIPEDLVMKLEGRAFGCDKCQEVCPWNKSSKPHNTPEFELPAEVELMGAEDWKNLSRKDFKRLFKKSAIGRRSYCRFMDNVEAAYASLSEKNVLPGR
jgi:epoxyqueuosine reductase